MFERNDYHYILPKEHIAQESVHPHHDAKLMVVSRENWEILDESTFWNIDRFLSRNRVLYFNNSRVEKARIRLKDVHYEKTNGERWIIEDGEILFTEKHSQMTFEWMVRPGKKFKAGTKIFFETGYVEVLSETETWRIFQTFDTDIHTIMEKYGELPLPPYIEYQKEKEADYQTSFAEKNGSIAAPTASLHFTKELLEKLPNKKHFLTLHVWLGTFKGINTVDVRDYQIHSETALIEISLFETLANEKKRGEIIVAVGTTSCRTLESLPHVWMSLDSSLKKQFSDEAQIFWNSMSSNLENIQVEKVLVSDKTIEFQTKIYIYPGIPFRIVDELITNFHLPESSLLVLVWAFLSREAILRIYREAIDKNYRFFSFWDGMYIKKS